MILYSQLTYKDKQKFNRVWSTSSESELVDFLETVGYASIDVHKHLVHDLGKGIRYLNVSPVSLKRIQERVKQLQQQGRHVSIEYRYYSLGVGKGWWSK